MNPILCWALTPASLQAVAGGTIPPSYFQWHHDMDGGVQLSRISVVGPADSTALNDWIARVCDLGLTPFLVLHDEERVEELADPPPEWSEVMVVRIGADLPGTIERLANELAMPDLDYLEHWAAFVQGRGRAQPSPISAWPAFALDYAQAVTAWRATDGAAAARAAAAVGFDLEGWNGPPLCFEDFNPAPARSRNEVAFHLAGHPGASFVKKATGWRTTALLPSMKAMVAFDDGHIRKELEDRLDALDRERSFADYLEVPDTVLAAPPATGAPVWTLHSTGQVRWKLEVYAPRGDPARPPAELIYDEADSPPAVDALRLAFVCVDPHEHWSQGAREVTLTLALRGATSGSAVQCEASPDLRRWKFRLPARQMMEAPAMKAKGVVCVGISVLPINR